MSKNKNSPLLKCTAYATAQNFYGPQQKKFDNRGIDNIIQCINYKSFISIIVFRIKNAFKTKPKT